MAAWLAITGFALLIMEILVGMVANTFIVLISCIDWIRSRKLSPTDLTLTCLGLSRLMWQATVMLQVIMRFFFLHTYRLHHLHLVLSMVWFFTYIVNLWFAACLSILYFVKITTFSHPLFLQVKQRFARLLPWLLLGSVAVSAFITGTIAAIIVLSNGSTICDSSQLLLNISFGSEIQRPHLCKQLFLAVTIPNFILSVIFLSSTILLIISLWKHTRHLPSNGISPQDLNIGIHLTAIKALASFAVLYLFSFVATNLQGILVWRSIDSSWADVLFQTMSAAYPSGHAVVLILINPKLKKAWIRMMHHLKCHVSEAPS